MKAKKLTGSWKAFDLTAVPIDENDPSTGKPKFNSLAIHLLVYPLLMAMLACLY